MVDVFSLTKNRQGWLNDAFAATFNLSPVSTASYMPRQQQAYFIRDEKSVKNTQESLVLLLTGRQLHGARVYIETEALSPGGSEP